MKDSKTPKIVVGVGLAAMYGALALYFLRDAPDRNVAENAATLSAEQGADAFVPLPAIAPSSTGMASAAGQPEELALAQSPAVAESPVVAQPPAVTQPPAATRSPAMTDSPQVAAAAQSRPPVVRPEPESAPAPAPQAEPAIVESQAPAREVASVDEDAASPAEQPQLPDQEAFASSSSGSDSQITAEVRTQIAAVAPASTIDVTTTNGAVELSGSVPSHEEANKVLMAARNVEHVRSVDGSALMVAN